MGHSSSKHVRHRICVLVDADNACPSDIAAVLKLAAEKGDVVTKRLYGGGPVLQAWRAPSLQHGIDVVHQYAFTQGKNATDMAMTIDAMDLLHAGGHTAFCLVTSDSDFTPLVHRLKKDGVEVHGFGTSAAPEALVQACGDAWHVVRDVRSAKPKEAPKPPITRSQSLAVLRADLLAKPALCRKIAGAVNTSTGADGVALLTDIGTTLVGNELPAKLRRVLDALEYDVVVTGNGRDHVRAPA
jgi:NYN domain